MKFDNLESGKNYKFVIINEEKPYKFEIYSKIPIKLIDLEKSIFDKFHDENVIMEENSRVYILENNEIKYHGFYSKSESYFDLEVFIPVTDEYIYFYSHTKGDYKSFSNFYPSDIAING